MKVNKNLSTVASYNNHLQRRVKLSKWMIKQANGEHSTAIFFSGTEKVRNRDIFFPFRPLSNFFYLTGFPEPESWLVITCDEKGNYNDTIFCLPKNPEKELWDGKRYGPKKAKEKFNFFNSFSTEKLEETLELEFLKTNNLFLPFSESDEIEELVNNILRKFKNSNRKGTKSPQKIFDISQIISSYRLIKDQSEIQTMKHAAMISSNAHKRAMKFCKPGKHEFEIEAELLHEFRKLGSSFAAYPSIVASGPNSCILHHKAGDRILKKGDILLIDAGCEFNGYASDITRSFPTSGKFSSPQRDIYEVVLTAQKKAIDIIKPGIDFLEPHAVAVREISQGLVDIGLIKNKSIDEVIENELYKNFFMHKTGHWLGMDVHDVGDYSTPLKSGMTFTIEPGCYIRPSKEVDKIFWNIGIRIEDDILVTNQGYEVLTKDVPVEISEIESLMERFKK